MSHGRRGSTQREIVYMSIYAQSGCTQVDASATQYVYYQPAKLIILYKLNRIGVGTLFLPSLVMGVITFYWNNTTSKVF
jgi:hypothetical protein